MANNKLNFFKNNLAYIIFSQAIIFITGFIKIPIYTSLFTTSELGHYSIVISSLNYLDILLLSWISSTFWRFVYENNIKELKSQLFSTLTSSIILLGIIGFIISFFLGTFVFKFNGSLTFFLLGFLSVFLQQMTSIFFMMLQAENKIRKWSFGLTLQNISSLLLFLLLVFIWDKNLKNIFISSIAINSIFLILGFLIYYPNLIKDSIKNWRRHEHLNKIISYSFQSTLVNILLVILINADRFIISHYKGPSQTGIYSQIYSAAFVGFSFVIQGFTNVLIPFFNKATISDSRKEDAPNIIKLYLIIFTPACIFLVMNAKLIIQLLLSEAYHPHYLVFSWVVAGIYIYGLANFFEIRLKLLNRINIVKYALITVAVFNLIANFYFLKDYDIKWAAIITFISYSLLLAFLIITNRKIVAEMKLVNEFAPIIIISMSLLLLIYLTQFYFQNLSPIVLIIISAIFLLLGYYILLKRNQILIYNCFNLLKQ